MEDGDVRMLEDGTTARNLESEGAVVELLEDGSYALLEDGDNEMLEG
jgi:hypothetical protein